MQHGTNALSQKKSLYMHFGDHSSRSARSSKQKTVIWKKQERAVHQNKDRKQFKSHHIVPRYTPSSISSYHRDNFEIFCQIHFFPLWEVNWNRFAHFQFQLFSHYMYSNSSNNIGLHLVNTSFFWGGRGEEAGGFVAWEKWKEREKEQRAKTTKMPQEPRYHFNNKNAESQNTKATVKTFNAFFEI